MPSNSDDLTVERFQRIQDQYERERRLADQKAGVLLQIKADLEREGYNSFEEAEAAEAKLSRKEKKAREQLEADLADLERELNRRDSSPERKVS